MICANRVSSLFLNQLIKRLAAATANFDNPLTIYFLEPPQVRVRGYERGLHGKVEFDFTIGKFGHVAEFIAVSALDALLVQLTLDAVRRWSFKSLTKNGQPVARMRKRVGNTVMSFLVSKSVHCHA